MSAGSDRFVELPFAKMQERIAHSDAMADR